MDNERATLSKILQALQENDVNRAKDIAKEKQILLDSQTDLDTITLVQPANVFAQVTQTVFQTSKTFAISAVASGFGATAVYPIDLVKTRMQNQVNLPEISPSIRERPPEWFSTRTAWTASVRSSKTRDF